MMPLLAVTDQRNKERNAAIIKRANRHASGRGGKAQTSSKANNLKPIDWYRMDEERIWNAQRTSLMNTAPARYTDKERLKHKLAETEKDRMLAGQDAYYSGSDIRLSPDRKLRITRQVSTSKSICSWLTAHDLCFQILSCQMAGFKRKKSKEKDLS
jgi:hypothetical protein